MNDFEGNSYAEILYHYFKDQFVEIYLGESSGTNYYSDYDVEQKVYTVGYIKGAKDNFILFEAHSITNTKNISRIMGINAWSVTAVMPVTVGEKIHITHFLQEIKR